MFFYGGAAGSLVHHEDPSTITGQHLQQSILQDNLRQVSGSLIRGHGETKNHWKK
jgi:hypothetical protein